ncbi:MAG: helix-turn-helix domain-containing protein [Actinomycetota bacterium]
MERWRVEELARRADVSVDTIRFYQKRRLLPPPGREGRIAWYGAKHVERLARIRELRAQGLTLALIARLIAGDIDATDVPLAAAVSAADTEGPEQFFTLEELADRSGVPLALLETVERESLLIARTHDGAPHYTDADVAIVRQGLSLLELGLPLSALLTLARQHQLAARDVAEEAVALFDQYIRQPLRASDRPDAEKAEELVTAFRALLPTVTALVAHHFRRVLLAVAQEHLERVGADTELAAVSAEAARRLEGNLRS